MHVMARVRNADPKVDVFMVRVPLLGFVFWIFMGRMMWSRLDFLDGV
jgi:hypothetical protein